MKLVFILSWNFPQVSTDSLPAIPFPHLISWGVGVVLVKFELLLTITPYINQIVFNLSLWTLTKSFPISTSNLLTNYGLFVNG